MKTNAKSFKLICTLVLLMLAVLGFVNITYSYFTATAKKDGEFNLGAFSVKFATLNEGSLTTVENNIRLYPSVSVIKRGESFGLMTGNGTTNVALDDLQITNGSGCGAYVRFWIDAYVITNATQNPVAVDTTINYGKYFALTRPNVGGNSNNFSRVDVIQQDSTSGEYSVQQTYYYIEKVLGSGYSLSLSNYDSYNDTNPIPLTLKDIEADNTLTTGNTTDKVNDYIPTEMLGRQLRITLSLEAFQEGMTISSTIFSNGIYNGEWD